jgi:hypothetical protein
LVNRLLHLIQVMPGSSGHLNVELTSDFAGIVIDAYVAGDLIVVDEPLVEARSLALAQAGAEQVKIVGISAAELRDVPDHVDPRQRDPILLNLPVSSCHLGDPDLLVRHRRSRGNIAEVFFDLRSCGVGVDITGQYEHYVGWPVVSVEPLLHVFE